MIHTIKDIYKGCLITVMQDLNTKYCDYKIVRKDREDEYGYLDDDRNRILDIHLALEEAIKKINSNL